VKERIYYCIDQGVQTGIYNVYIQLQK